MEVTSMAAIRTLALAAAVMAAGWGGTAAPAAAAITPSGIDERVRLDWEAGATRAGKPVIRGYVLNAHGRPAANVRLLVETLDGSGVVVARTIGFVPGVVQFNDRAYFEVPLKAPGASYRVTVSALDWRAGGNGT
jgi:hypothetical protein